MRVKLKSRKSDKNVGRENRVVVLGRILSSQGGAWPRVETYERTKEKIENRSERENGAIVYCFLRDGKSFTLLYPSINSNIGMCV